MANTLTGLMPSIYEALDMVSREMVGMVPAVRSDFDATRAAVGQSIIFPVVGAITPGDVTPAATGPTGSDSSAPGSTVTISKSKSVPIFLTGEEDKGLSQTISKQIFYKNSIAQAMRQLVNLIEIDLATVGVAGASRAYGTAGTTPFATAADMTDFAMTAKILDDNGAPAGDRQLVLNSAAKANMLAKQANLFNSGSTLLLRGVASQMGGFFLGYSAGLAKHTKGTGASYVTSGSAAAGVTDIALVTGSGTVLAGDVVTFAADAVNKYVVGTGVAAAGTIKLNKPGALVTIATANAMTIGADFTPNLAFDRNAIWLATRAPAVPDGGDAATDATIVVDPVSGLAFEVREYRQYRRVAWEIAIAWGYAAVKSEHIAILLG